MSQTQETAPSLHPASLLPASLVDRLLGSIICSPEAALRTLSSPCDGSVLAGVPQSGPADVDLAFRTARRVQPRWAATSLSTRKRIMLRFHDLLIERREQGLDVIQAETGKARADALEELLDVCQQARHYGRSAASLLAPERRPGAFPVVTKAQVRRHPLGVVGIISPWNYPLTMALSDAVPALMAGNTVVLKPDSQTPLTALWAVDLLYQAGLPQRALQVVVGPGTQLGPEITDRADFLMFTGSTAVGRVLAAACGKRLVGAAMELGGKNPMIILADADIAKAAAIATRACFSNAGQLCVSIERIYVVAEVYDQFLDAFIAKVRALKVGTGIGWDHEMGSLFSAGQLASVSAAVDQARAQGAKVEIGGRARPDLGPYCYEPTVLTGVTPEMEVFAEETFGPVVSVYPVASAEEALVAANNSKYGLNASIITRDLARGRALAASLKAGTVNVNEGYAAAWASNCAPMGGMRDSGLGRRHGRSGLTKYTEEQTIATQRWIDFGPPLGMSPERFGAVLTAAVAGMKWIGRK